MSHGRTQPRGARPGQCPGESEARMSTRLLRATLVAIMVCSGFGASFAQELGPSRLKLMAGVPRVIPPMFTPRVTLTGVIHPEDVRFRWALRGAEEWGDPQPGGLIRGNQFWAPAPGGEEGQVWKLCAEEGDARAQCPGVFTINSNRGESLAAISRLGVRGIVVGYADGKLGETAPLSLRESGLMLRRALIAAGRATASPNARPGPLLVARGIWMGREEAIYTTTAGTIPRRDFAAWVGRLLAADDPTVLASKQPLDIATERGIVKGYPDGDLSWDKPVTRGEAAIMLDRALTTLKKPVE